MNKIEFKLNIKKQTRYDLIKEISDKLREPIPKWLGRLKLIETQDIDKIYRSPRSSFSTSKKGSSKISKRGTGSRWKK